MKLNHRQIWTLLYATLAALELLGEALPVERLVYWTKPLLMPVLALGFLIFTRNHRSFFQTAIAGALVASTIGDVLLMLNPVSGGQLYFLLGLAAFLFAQMQYIGAFGSRAGWHLGYLNAHPLHILPMALYLCVFLWVLWPHLSTGMQVPVVFYGLALCTMVLSAVNLRGVISRSAWRPLMLGAVLFLASDSVLAFNKFVYPFSGARVVIMATYILGQWFLVQGAIQTLFINGPTRQKSRPGRQTI
ncbi:MAG: lysoplasmalogenase [Saprospiraceae bacterium]